MLKPVCNHPQSNYLRVALGFGHRFSISHYAGKLRDFSYPATVRFAFNLNVQHLDTLEKLLRGACSET